MGDYVQALVLCDFRNHPNVVERQNVLSTEKNFMLSFDFESDRLARFRRESDVSHRGRVDRSVKNVHIHFDTIVPLNRQQKHLLVSFERIDTLSFYIRIITLATSA